MSEEKSLPEQVADMIERKENVTINEMFDRLNIPKDNRSDFAVAALIKQAHAIVGRKDKKIAHCYELGDLQKEMITSREKFEKQFKEISLKCDLRKKHKYGGYYCKHPSHSGDIASYSCLICNCGYMSDYS